jgi:prepilin-type N-terminal cleavage/methylation domain-containing protein
VYARGWFELSAPAKGHAGFSLTELVVALAVALILMAIGLPAFLRAYRAYELSNAARQVADILRLARYEAIRLNTPVQCIIQASGTNTNVWVDSIKNGTLDPTEKMILLGPSGNLMDGGSVPGTSALITAAAGPISPTAPSPSASGIWFDARGAVMPPSAVNVFYLSSALAPEAGYRAVFLMPAGSLQIWTADTTGNWQQQR